MLSRNRVFAGYNAWCNARLYAAVVSFSDADYRANRGAFLKSLRGTLNHLLVGDRVWMAPFTATSEAPKSLDAISMRTSQNCGRHGKARKLASSAILTV